MIRDKLKDKYPRCHYNGRNKSKQEFNTQKEADEYIRMKKLKEYSSYECPICNKWHVGKDVK